MEKELVEKGERDQRTNYYALTDGGEAAIEDRRQWEERFVDV